MFAGDVLVSWHPETMIDGVLKLINTCVIPTGLEINLNRSEIVASFSKNTEQELQMNKQPEFHLVKKILKCLGIKILKY